VHARFVISWRWIGSLTRLRAIVVHGLPRAAQLAVRCLGRDCPRLRIKHVRADHVWRLLKELRGMLLHAGDRLRITVTAPHLKAERVELLIRDGAGPRGRLLKG
jgi:hypothetical protein